MKKHLNCVSHIGFFLNWLFATKCIHSIPREQFSNPWVKRIFKPFPTKKHTANNWKLKFWGFFWFIVKKLGQKVLKPLQEGHSKSELQPNWLLLWVVSTPYPEISPREGDQWKPAKSANQHTPVAPGQPQTSRQPPTVANLWTLTFWHWTTIGYLRCKHLDIGKKSASASSSHHQAAAPHQPTSSKTTSQPAVNSTTLPHPYHGSQVCCCLDILWLYSSIVF